MSHNLVVRVTNALEECEAFGSCVLGVIDLALKRNSRARSTGPGLLEHAPIRDGMALISAELITQFRERLPPIVLRGLLEELSAIIGQCGLDAICGDGLEMARKEGLSVLLPLGEAATAEQQRKDSEYCNRENLSYRRFHARDNG